MKLSWVRTYGVGTHKRRHGTITCVAVGGPADYCTIRPAGFLLWSLLTRRPSLPDVTDDLNKHCISVPELEDILPNPLNAKQGVTDILYASSIHQKDKIIITIQFWQTSLTDRHNSTLLVRLNTASFTVLCGKTLILFPLANPVSSHCDTLQGADVHLMELELWPAGRWFIKGAQCSIAVSCCSSHITRTFLSTSKWASAGFEAAEKLQSNSLPPRHMMTRWTQLIAKRIFHLHRHQNSTWQRFLLDSPLFCMYSTPEYVLLIVEVLILKEAIRDLCHHIVNQKDPIT